MKENDIVLQTAIHSDLIKIHKWLNLDTILKYFGGRDHDKPFIEDIENEYGPKNNSNLLMIYYKDNPVGFIDVFEFSGETNKRHGLSENEKAVFSLDIVVGEIEVQNKGIGSTALTKLLQILFLEKAVNKVVLDTYVWHKQAIHCYKKCGFKITRILKNHEKYEGKYVDDIFMEITKEDYLKLHSSINNCI